MSLTNLLLGILLLLHGVIGFFHLPIRPHRLSTGTRFSPSTTKTLVAAQPARLQNMENRVCLSGDKQ